MDVLGGAANLSTPPVPSEISQCWLAPRKAVLTHMHVPLDYDTVMAETPARVEPGYDGMIVEIAYDSM